MMTGLWRIALVDGATLVKSGELRFADDAVTLWSVFDGVLVLALWLPRERVASITRSK